MNPVLLRVIFAPRDLFLLSSSLLVLVAMLGVLFKWSLEADILFGLKPSLFDLRSILFLLLHCSDRPTF